MCGLGVRRAGYLQRVREWGEGGGGMWGGGGGGRGRREKGWGGGGGGGGRGGGGGKLGGGEKTTLTRTHEPASASVSNGNGRKPGKVPSCAVEDKLAARKIPRSGARSPSC